MPANNLINEKSPYLLQHAHNPVDWHPWSQAAFDKAAAQDKPIFLSVGYATCHWCHVMEKESFEDEEAARALNDTFVCIKVDREERPDIDAVYMAACNMLTGGGGWPLTIFMTPEKQPFFAGTYIPKENRFGRMGLVSVCAQVKSLWLKDRTKALDAAAAISQNLGDAFAYQAAEEPDESVLKRAFEDLEKRFDAGDGGFESAPKFPTPHRLLFLLRWYHRTGNPKALEMVTKTLTAMRRGGIWDHVGFGFHRYSTDRRWLLPHFEKMLYDQALVALACLEAFQTTRDALFARTARDIFTYVLRDMTAAEGPFFAAEDADSEGEEGKFYVWTAEAFRSVVGADAHLWEKAFNLRAEGNFHDEATRALTGANILHMTDSMENLALDAGIPAEEFERQWEETRRRLFAAREARVHPLKDDKILTDWNGLMIAALARGGRVLKSPRYTQAARSAADFILSRMRDPHGRLYHRFRQGEAAIQAMADDYAFLIFGLIELFQSSFDPALLETAVALQEIMITDFWDESKGGFFLTPAGNDDLIVRPKQLYDGAIPSANSLSLLNLLTIGRLTGQPLWEARAQEQVKAFAGNVDYQPLIYTAFLMGLDFVLSPGQEIVIAGEPEAPDTQRLLAALNLNFSPNKVTMLKSEKTAGQLAGLAGYTDGLQLIQGRATAHVCKGFACRKPVSDENALLEMISGSRNDKAEE